MPLTYPELEARVKMSMRGIIRKHLRGSVTLALNNTHGLREQAILALHEGEYTLEETNHILGLLVRADRIPEIIDITDSCGSCDYTEEDSGSILRHVTECDITLPSRREHFS